MTITNGVSGTAIPGLLLFAEMCFSKIDMDNKLQAMNDIIQKWSLGLAIGAGVLVGVIGAIFGIVAGGAVATLLPGVGVIAGALTTAGIASGFMATIVATMLVSGGISLGVLFLLKALCVSAGTCSCVESKGMCLVIYHTRILWFWVEVPFWSPLRRLCPTIEPNCP